MKSVSNRAFTLIEVLVAVVLVGVGISSILTGLSRIGKAQAQNRERERMQRLANTKLGELLATREVQGSGAEGDFQEWGEPGYRWSAETADTGIENLEALTITVRPRDRGTDLSVSVDGLLFQPPQTGGTP